MELYFNKKFDKTSLKKLILKQILVIEYLKHFSKSFLYRAVCYQLQRSQFWQN